jgi:hypothetical protein
MCVYVCLCVFVCVWCVFFFVCVFVCMFVSEQEFMFDCAHMCVRLLALVSVHEMLNTFF